MLEAQRPIYIKEITLIRKTVFKETSIRKLKRCVLAESNIAIKIKKEFLVGDKDQISRTILQVGGAYVTGKYGTVMCALRTGTY